MICKAIRSLFTLPHASRLKVKQQAEQDTQGNCGYEVWKIKNGLEQVPAPEPVLVQQKGQNQAEYHLGRHGQQGDEHCIENRFEKHRVI